MFGEKFKTGINTLINKASDKNNRKKFFKDNLLEIVQQANHFENLRKNKNGICAVQDSYAGVEKYILDKNNHFPFIITGLFLYLF